jgi:hypothetical protein
MIIRRLTKAENKEMFFEPCFSCLLLFLSSFFATKILRILKLIRSFHDAKLIPSLSSL